MPYHMGCKARNEFQRYGDRHDSSSDSSDSSDDDSSFRDSSYDDGSDADSFVSRDSDEDSFIHNFSAVSWDSDEEEPSSNSPDQAGDSLGGEDPELAVLILSPAEMLCRGLAIAGFTPQQIAGCSDITNIARFMDQYGASHIVYCNVWKDLLTTNVQDAAVPRDKAKLEHFLMSTYFLKKCPTELDREAKFHFSHATIATWTWYYLKKIQALKKKKIVWDEGGKDDIWILTVDGTHCWINEPKHPTLSQDSAYYSHKYNKAGVDYEFGISLSTNRLVWMSGPHPAGDCSDKTVFTFTNGLRDKLRAAKKRGIGDRGYVGYDELSTPNAHDDKVVSLFKRRALSRHENFNGMTKVFRCLDGRFRHSLDKFAMCFESICVICQYQLEHGVPLYDVLTPSMAE